MKFCPHCGKQLQFEKAEICPACGCRVEESRGPEAANTFNSVVAIILIAILAVLCLIAASIGPLRSGFREKDYCRRHACLTSFISGRFVHDCRLENYG